MGLGVLVVALAFLALAQYVVETPAAVEGGNCVVGYLPPKFSNSVEHDGVIYLWADRPVEVSIYYASGSVQQSSGTELRLEVGARDVVVVRNPHNTGVVYTACRGEPRLPIGLADYGIAMTNPPVAYSYETREVRAFATLKNFDAYSVNEKFRGFSIQLNLVVMVRTDGKTQYYLLQNVIDLWDFWINFVNNIWNLTAVEGVMRSYAIKGTGVVRDEKFYARALNPEHLSLPISVALYIRVGLSRDGQPWFAFGYDVGRGVVWYDNVTFLVKARDVKIVVRPPREGLTGSGHQMNIELVVCGICCGDHAVFKSLNLDLRLEYWNGTAYVPPPFLYNFGSNTGETAEGVSVAYLGGGSARLSAGVFRPALLYSGYVPVRVVDADGAKWFAVRNGTLLDLRRPPVVYVGDKTRVLYFGNSLGADAVAATRPLNVTYSFRREHLVAVRDWNGTAYRWVAEGAVIAYEPGDVYLSNGTRLAVSQVYVDGAPAGKTVKTTVAKPTEISVTRVRQYLIRLIAPVNSTEVWVDAGSAYVVGLPDPWDLPNGTRFAGLLVNGTAQRDFRVDKPMTLRAQYAEVYYWAVVETPVNKTAGWTPKGAVLKFPDVVDFGNGTRHVRLGPASIRVDGPVAARVEYKRQYYVKIVGVAQWEGWVDEGAVVRLNATVVGGVEYTPAEVVTATGPGVYKPLFYAIYRTVARDGFGVPNPLATVRLCNATAQAGLDGSAVVAAYTRELCQPTVEAPPISPYTAAGAVALVAAFALKRRRK